MRLEPALRAALRPAIGLAINKGGLAGWSPRALFAAGEQGAWYDPSDLSTLFQDSAGTTPVTAVGQPVGLVKDKSGRGNHASQATATARPTLQQDSGGRYYLSFDGTDDSLATGNVDLSGTDKLAVFAGVRRLSDAAQGTIVSIGMGYGSQAGGFELMAAVAAGANYSFGLQGTAACRVQTDNSFAAGATHVLSCAYDIAQVAKAQEILPRINAAIPPLTGTAPGTDAGTGNFANAPLYMGRRAGSSLPLNGRIYGLIVRGAASTAGQIASAERYLAARSGVTL